MDDQGKYIYHFVKIPPSKQVPLHQQQTWELSLVILGCGQRIIGEDTSDFTSGDLLLIPPGLSHAWYFNPNLTDKDGNIVNITIMINESLLTGLKTLIPELEQNIDRLLKTTSALSFESKSKQKLSRLMKEMDTMDKFHRAKAILDILFIILDSLDQTQHIGQITSYDENQQRMMQVHIYVTSNYMRPFGTSEMALHLGLNKSSFCTFFKKCTGMTFINYLNDFRLDQAMFLLGDKSKKRSIQDVCFEVGFQSVPHFNHLFKKKFGKSPRQLIP